MREKELLLMRQDPVPADALVLIEPHLYPRGIVLKLFEVGSGLNPTSPAPLEPAASKESVAKSCSPDTAPVQKRIDLGFSHTDRNV